MKKLHGAGTFIAGFLTAALMISMAVPTLAALSSKWIEVYTGVDIYVDDVKLKPKDVNGNPVEVFVYNGTTYLPVRAVGEAVGKTVQWEGKTNSVYLGKHTGDKPAVWLTDLESFYGPRVSNEYSGNRACRVDNTGKEHSNFFACGFSSYDSKSCTYMINGQYSKITGCFYQPMAHKSEPHDAHFSIYGDGKLLYSATMHGGMQPIDFSVDLTGVLKLEITTYAEWSLGAGYQAYGCIGECGLWT